MKESLGSSVKAAIDLYKGNSAMNQSSITKSLEVYYYIFIQPYLSVD